MNNFINVEDESSLQQTTAPIESSKDNSLSLTLIHTTNTDSSLNLAKTTTRNKRPQFDKTFKKANLYTTQNLKENKSPIDNSKKRLKCV